MATSPHTNFPLYGGRSHLCFPKEAHGGRMNERTGKIAAEPASISSSGLCNQSMAREQSLQMLALFESVGADRFSLTWRTMDEQIARVRKHWRTDYIRRQLPGLLAEAERDRLNLFIRPYATRTSLLQLDDLTPERAGELAPLSFVTLQTSPGKAQAWIAVPSTGNDDDDRDFRRRVKKAAHSDPMASGSVRLAGSLNFKPKYVPDFPRVTVTHAAPGRIVTPEALHAVGLVASPEPPPAVLPAAGHHFGRSRTWPDYEQCLAGAPTNQSVDFH
jgi:hypothetical protein